MIGLSGIEAAETCIHPRFRRTPVMTVNSAQNPAPSDAKFIHKLKLSRRTGSFEARDAMNRLRGAGIVTASDGNRGLDTVVIVVGSSGKIPLTGTSFKALSSAVRMIAAEPEVPPTLNASPDAGFPRELLGITSQIATTSCRQSDAHMPDLPQYNAADVVLLPVIAMQAAEWLWLEFGIAADLTVAVIRSDHPAFSQGAELFAFVCGDDAEGARDVGTDQ